MTHPGTPCHPCCLLHSFTSPSEASNNFVQLSFHDEASGPKSCRECLAYKCRATERQSVEEVTPIPPRCLLLLHPHTHSSCLHCTHSAETIFRFSNASEVMSISNQNRVRHSLEHPGRMLLFDEDNTSKYEACSF